MTEDASLFPDLPPAEPPAAADALEAVIRNELTGMRTLAVQPSFRAWKAHQDAATRSILAAADEYRAQALNELAAELRDEGKRQRSVRHGLNFAATIAEMKAKATG